MKRTKSIRLVFIGGLSLGALTGCNSGNERALINSENVYTNNFYIPGAGYYHAPFRAWYPRPYNDYDAQTRRYFFGGQWDTLPHQSITNISSPTAQTAQQAQTQRTDISRGGFGHSSGYHHIWS